MEFPLPKYIQLYPTTKCNQRCNFCFNAENRTSSVLTFNDALMLLDILADNGINDIDIMGGEPFLLPWIVDFIYAGIAKDMSLNISTNGSMPAELELLRGLSHEQFNIGISLEGSTAEKHNRLTGSKNFTSTFESIKKLVDFLLDPIVKTILCPDTAKDIQNIVNLLRGIGVKRYYIIHMDILNKEDFIMKKAIDYTAFVGFYQKIQRENPDIAVHSVNASCFESNSLPHGVRCAGGVRKLFVMPDGAVFPCNLFHTLKGFEIGNIFRDDFSAIWNHPKLDLFRRYNGNNCDISACENRNSCTGGCPAHGFYHSGNPQATDIRCLQSRR